MVDDSLEKELENEVEGWLEEDLVKKAVPPVKTAFLGLDGTDIALTSTGIALAAFAAFFPWYVVFHFEDFAINGKGLPQHLRRDLPVGPPRPVFSVSPSASININAEGAQARTELPKHFDDFKTATIPDQKTDSIPKISEAQAEAQPLPGVNHGYKLLHVSGGRALIEDTNGMFIVAIGGVLPDNSHLKSIEQRDGKWVLLTSNGDVIGMD